MLSSFCSPLNYIPDIPGIISVVTAGIISVVRIISVAEIISMVGIISVAVRLTLSLVTLHCLSTYFVIILTTFAADVVISSDKTMKKTTTTAATTTEKCCISFSTQVFAETKSRHVNRTFRKV